MSTQTMNAGSNPDEANALISKVLEEKKSDTQEVQVRYPSDNVVTLPAGFIDPDGGVITTVEVRELNGRDEEYISKATTVGRVLNAVLSRGAVKVGELPVTEDVLNKMLAGDRETVLLGIHRATFGNPLEVNGYCQTCEEPKAVSIDLFEDIEIRTLKDPIADRTFKVKGRDHEYTVSLPDGAAQKELQANIDKSLAELSTILLQHTVTEIDGEIVFSKSAVQNMGLVDRRTVSEQIALRNPGPVFKDIEADCPDCGKEVVVPISLGSLFQF